VHTWPNCVMSKRDQSVFFHRHDSTAHHISWTSFICEISIPGSHHTLKDTERWLKIPWICMVGSLFWQDSCFSNPSINNSPNNKHKDHHSKDHHSVLLILNSYMFRGVENTPEFNEHERSINARCCCFSEPWSSKQWQIWIRLLF